ASPIGVDEVEDDLNLTRKTRRINID
ncbi:hypothetical protein TrRE_jg10855, partial [Triparma retinervis]